MIQYSKNIKTSALSLLSVVSMVSIAHAAQTPWNAVSEHLTESMIAAVPTARKVAVVDNGFVTDHPGLKNHLVEGYNGRDNNTNIDASIIKDKTHHAYNKTAPHGTHVAGIIAQMIDVEIVPVKRGSSGNRTTQSDVASLTALIGRDDIDVVNLSFGIDWKAMIDPITKLAQEGKTIVIAAGNSGATIKDQKISSQGKYLSEILRGLNGRVVLVGATDKKNGVEDLTSFSNKPSDEMAEFYIAVPGSEIISYVPADSDKTGTQAQSGTSMAAPLFVGAVMKLATKFDISVDEARNAVFATATKGNNPGHGFMDYVAAHNSLKAKAAYENLFKAQIFTSEDLKDIEEKAAPHEEKIEEEAPVKSVPVQSAPNSEGYLSQGLSLLKDGLEKVYQTAQTAASYVAVPFQSAYNYLSSWF